MTEHEPVHDSDCAVHNEPALPAGPCDCGKDLLGRVATAICDSLQWDWADGYSSGQCVKHARAAIEAHKASLSEQGLVIVPREPTEDMLDGGGMALNGTLYNCQQSERVYKAMITAALGEE